MVKSLAKCLPHPMLYRLYHRVHMREEATRAKAAAANAGLPLLDSLNIRSLKKSDTVFILGSAWSINDISNDRWRIIGRHGSIGFNFWPAHSFVPQIYVFESLAYHDHPLAYAAFRPLLERRCDAYANTVKIITDVRPLGPHQLLFDLPEGMRKSLYLGYTMPVIARSELEMEAGLRYMESLGAFKPSDQIPWLFKYGGSVIAMISLGLRMGYRRIVLCGIDLDRQEYFYHHRERYPEYADWEFSSRKDPHLTTRRLPWMIPSQSVIYLLKRLILDPAGIELFVESHNSTLYPEVPLASESLFAQLSVPEPAVSDS